MSGIDLLWASNKAREHADREIQNCYAPQFRDSMQAGLQWARAFHREFNALTNPSPSPIPFSGSKVT